MSTVSSVTSASTDTSNDSTSALSTQLLDSEDFYNLLVAEVTNQDPLDPVSNQELTLQLMQLQNTSAMSEVTDSMESMVASSEELNENLLSAFSSLQSLSSLSSATSMIGKDITYKLDDSTGEVSGTVDSIKINDGTAYLMIDDTEVALDNVLTIS